MLDGNEPTAMELADDVRASSPPGFAEKSSNTVPDYRATCDEKPG
ncbi:hypothetical protein [Kribbella sp. NPDC051620]